MSKQIYRPRAISGFCEWLPEVRIVELQWLDEIRRTFESFGFCSIETPAVEELDVLQAKGETDKEIYCITRLQADEQQMKESRLALHYDLTVPLARYVAQHFNDLVFPFKRYQIQPVWRGERPQEGRYRQFYQCDIDVINVDKVPLHFDAEMPAIVYEVFERLGIGQVQFRLNNRKILQGYYEGLGIEDIVSALRIVDKLDKIGRQGVIEELESQLQFSQELAKRCLEIAAINTSDSTFVDKVEALGVKSPQLEEGLEELAFVVDSLQHLPRGAISVDLAIARGFDYYTGTVYECQLEEFPGLGSVCSGGRYDDLAGSFIKRNLPGVGISIGLTRLFSKMLAAGKLPTGSKCPTQIMVVIPSEERRQNAVETAKILRQRGFNIELYHAPEKLTKQIRYASRKGIAYVWFPPFAEDGKHEVKNMQSGQQAEADPTLWAPDNM